MPTGWKELEELGVEWQKRYLADEDSGSVTSWVIWNMLLNLLDSNFSFPNKDLLSNEIESGILVFKSCLMPISFV